MCFFPKPKTSAAPAEKQRAVSPDVDVGATRARVRAAGQAGFGSTNVTGGQGVTRAADVIRKRLLGV